MSKITRFYYRLLSILSEKLATYTITIGKKSTFGHPLTSANPLYHEVLFNYHVLGDTNPGYPPFYDHAFFEMIKNYPETSPLNIKVMTKKQWYRVLLEDQVIMSLVGFSNK